MAPFSENALRSSDSLSDTKIFVLLAAIVFVFLLALGVAMTRVSRGRRRQQEGMRQHIVAASAAPQTLSKTILDTLPVFEVTDKHQLRPIQAQSPRVALNECFAERYADYGTPSAAAAVAASHACEGSASRTEPAKGAVQVFGGYDLDSGNSSLCSVPTRDSRCLGDDSANGHFYRGPASIVLASNQGAVELSRYPAVSGAKKGDLSPPPGASSIGRLTACSTPPVALRYYGHDAFRSATPPASARHSAGEACWGDDTPGCSPCMYLNAGAIAYREGSTQSLGRSPDRGSPMGAAHVQWPCEARLVHRSHPEISQGTPAPARDGESGLGSCPICLEEFEPGEQLRELPCLHKYHVVCIDTWLVSRSTCCPYCKLDIRQWYYGPDFEDGIPHSGPLGRGEALPGGVHGLAEEMAGDAAAAVGPGARRGRRLRRIQRSREGPGRLTQVWLAMRRTIV
ncbi:hypothetical protein LPJ61_003527 [Coemansia biformis]|uniref:RING-type domain-containing protein n=1 Tax=Coemansia biformis TaxID=1286918 RepID=A0A9W7YC03_9FUNG|nr:hypothetical protein LPJ61_003527 [Coemansia biformis]